MSTRSALSISRWAGHIWVGVVFIGLASSALGADWATFDVPGASTTNPVAINANGTVTGTWFQINSPSINSHGFLRTLDGIITTFDVPSATNTYPTSINANGTVTGSYTDAIGLQYGFLRAPDGTFTTFVVPGAYLTSPTSINASGVIIGQYISSSNDGGFVRAPDGTFTTFGVSHTFPTVINDAGLIAGDIFGPCTSGFLRTLDGTITTFVFPGGTCGGALGMNSSGEIVGTISDQTSHARGFLRTLDGTITTFGAFIPPQSVGDTLACCIDSSCQIVGEATFYSPGPGALEPFVRANSGAIKSLTPPTCKPGVFVLGMNDFGWITGLCATAASPSNASGYVMNIH